MTILSRPRQANPRGSGSLGAGDSRSLSAGRTRDSLSLCDKRPLTPSSSTQLSVSIVSRVS